LGVNLEHFLATERGFSLKGNAPLDMRFDQGMTRTAADVVNTYTPSDLQSLFVRYADFTSDKAQELANTIVSERRKHLISTTFDLKKVLGLCGLGNSAVAVIFQAIRIEVNGELNNLDTFLKKFSLVLNS
jgi:16S rRNA (cytosine1402-N4)-methyltransferase